MSDTKNPDPVVSDTLARIAAIKARREARALALESPEAKAAEATKELADLEAIEKAICDFGPEGKEIAYVKTDRGVVIVKRPSAPTFKKFQEKDEPKVADIRALVAPCVVHPSQGEFDEIIEYWPLVLNGLATLVARLAGGRISIDAGK
jgi:hypothetical protein